MTPYAVTTQCQLLSAYQLIYVSEGSSPLQWRHNERDGVLNHQPHDCLLNPLFRHKFTLYLALQWRYNERDGLSNHRRLHDLLSRLFRRRSKKNQSSAPLAFVRGIHRWPVNSPHKGPVTRKKFPFDDVTMHYYQLVWSMDWGSIGSIE